MGTGNDTELSPVSIPGLGSGVSDIGFSESFGCAIKSGSLYCVDGLSSYSRVISDGYGYRSANTIFRELPYAGTQNLKLHIFVSGWNSGCVEDTSHSFRCFEGTWYGSGWFMSQRDSFTPLEFKALPHVDVKKLKIGQYNGCALDQEKSLWCWGMGTFPTSGDFRSSAHPTLVKELEGKIVDFEMAGYSDNVCAVTDNGDVYCWGDNSIGQLGDGTLVTSSSPVKVVGIANATKVIPLGDSACALLSNKTVQCWGSNMYGSLGDGSGVDSLSPVVAQGLGAVEDLVGYGSAICALTTPGAVYCWGMNWTGQIGNGDSGNDALAPVQVVGLGSGVVEIIRTSRASFCVRMNNGDIKCWGDEESIGDGTGVSKDTPITAILPLPATKLYPGPCARLSDQSLYCWGNNYFAQNTMDGSIADHKLTPVPFVWSGHDISEVIDVQTGRCVKTADQKYYCWGYNAYSVLGDMRFDATKMVFSNKWFEQ